MDMNINQVPLEIFYIYFSPYTAHAIEVNGLRFPTVEHAYQCARYNDKKITVSGILERTARVKT